MAGLTKVQRAERAALKDAAQVDDGLVPVANGGETLRVHPSCLRAHIKLGWRVISDDSADSE